jgi:hypothetical protein
MQIEFTMSAEQQAADDLRRAAYDRDARQRTPELPPAEYAAARAAAIRPARPAAPVAGPHARDLDAESYRRELQRLGVRPSWKSRPVRY